MRRLLFQGPFCPKHITRVNRAKLDTKLQFYQICLLCITLKIKYLPQLAKAKTGSYSQVFPALHVPDRLPLPHSFPRDGQSRLVRHDRTTQQPFFPEGVGLSILLHWGTYGGQSLAVLQSQSVSRSFIGCLGGISEKQINKLLKSQYYLLIV